MKIVILTTETLHHTFFVQSLVKGFKLEKVLVENNIHKAPFETHHPFEDLRESYERQVFFNGRDIVLADVADILAVKSINETKAIDCLKKIRPEIIIVFGTGKISKEVIQICPEGIINLHGGDPEKYRGLDSHLWAIYQNDFNNFKVTLHRVNEKLDDGDVILQEGIPITKGMSLYELRRYNTEVCLKLVLSALDMYRELGRFISWPQGKRGQNYSFMPAGLKEICAARFKKYTENIK